MNFSVLSITNASIKFILKMGRKNNNSFDNFRHEPSDMLKEFMANMKAQEESEKASLNVPNSAQDELSEFLLTGDLSIDESVITGNKLSESSVSHSNSSRLINDEELSSSDIIISESVETIIISEEMSNSTATLTNEQTTVSTLADKPSIRETLGVQFKLSLEVSSL